MPTILEVALPIHLYTNFDYLTPASLSENQIQRGARVKVPFNGRDMIGICLKIKAHSDYPIEKLKTIESLVDDAPCIPEPLLNLIQWASNYYVYPYGEALSASLPKRLREGLPEQTLLYWQHTTEGKGLPEDALKRAPKQQKLHKTLLERNQIPESDLSSLGIPRAAANALTEKGLITLSAGNAPKVDTQEIHESPPLALDEQQQQALHQIRYHDFHCYLLEGITGSGKTEVYLQAIARVLQTGRQALVLVPEIGLTPQTVSRFKSRFKVSTVELHSDISDGARELNWCAARDGKAQIVIGTRLASLCPMNNLGIIIIDEEHDASYKQQDNFRYSARDISIFRAKQLSIPIILGTATPSLETLHNALNGRYKHLRLTQRAGTAKPPTLETVDLRNQQLTAGLAPTSLDHIKETIDRNEQVMIFVNRRGYAPALLCHHCGWVAKCQNCDANLTVHHSPRHLHCHHCDNQRSIPTKCPSCHNNTLLHKGLGTEQIEQTLEQHFPNTPITRIDRDSTSGKGAFAAALKALKLPTACITVGTQMLAKGHHLPNITLVVIVDSDQGLMSSDFRGTERLGQLITQVAGRSGREQKKGKVIIQSHTPEHPLLELLLRKGYHHFARELLSERKALRLPPYSQLAIFRAESKRPENAIELLELCRRLCEELEPPSQEIGYLGPFPSLIERIKDRYRYQLQISGVNRKKLNNLLRSVTSALSDHAIAKRTRWSLDVDGME